MMTVHSALYTRRRIIDGNLPICFGISVQFHALTIACLADRTSRYASFSVGTNMLMCSMLMMSESWQNLVSVSQFATCLSSVSGIQLTDAFCRHDLN
jgi:hypothetical protein